jgi:hypothetical protein
LIDELHQTGDEEIIDEIDPLIHKLIEYSKTQSSFSTLAEAHLLKGRLALIQLKFEAAQKYFTQAEEIAEEHDLQRLAQQISAEHDKFLRELDIWQKMELSQSPLEKRLELASTEDIIRRLQGKQSFSPPEIEDETPLLLIIMSTGGTPIFVNPFSNAWGTQEAMFGSFLSAVSSWGKGVFAESIDRIIFEKNIILMKTLEPFTVCYVIQGQSYPAQQKLTRFVTEIQTQKQIWEKLQESHRSSLLLDSANTPVLGTVVTEIFSTKVEGEN